MDLKGFVDNGGLCELGVVAAGGEGRGLGKTQETRHKTQDSSGGRVGRWGKNSASPARV